MAKKEVSYITHAEAEKLKTDLTTVFWILGSVLAVGFITVLVAMLSPIIDAWRFRTTTYQNLIDKVNQTNAQVQTLTNEIHQKRGFY